MRDKRISHDDVIAQLRDGMTIGIGGWGSRRKPMSLVRAILQSSLQDLTVVAYGGPDVGLLCASGKARRVITGFVSLDSIPLEPLYRQARERGTIEVREIDEGMLQWGLYAAALRLPFLPTRAGLGSDVLALNQQAIGGWPALRTVRSPYAFDGASGDGGDGEELIAVPAIELDAAIVHMNRADAAGNAQFLGPDLYFDDLFLGAVKTGGKRFVSTERVVATEALLAEGSVHTLRIHRGMVDGVIEAHRGAHFTECPPDYGRDEALQKQYATAAADPAAWKDFYDRFCAVSHDEYLRAVEGSR
jgi:glutaconate CoA-transferase subunit A